MFLSKNRVERRVVRTFWDDGLIDVLSGLGVLLVGIAWQFDLVPLGAVAPALLIPFWRPLRARITEPRLGYVEFSDAQVGRHRSFLTWSIVAGCLTFLLGVSLYFFATSTAGVVPLQNWIAALPACLIGCMAFLTSFLILTPRFIGYAAVFCVSGALVVLLAKTPGLALIAGGAVVTTLGMFRLLSFIRSHPLTPMEANGG
jgi:hypothetical protein